MTKNLKIYYIDDKYVNYLRKFDAKVAYNKSETRPYVGVVYTFNEFTYFAPLSSPKPKHITMAEKAIDIFKIDGGNLGIVNINNMIPTPIECLKEVLPTITDSKYKALIENQTTFLNDHRQKLLNKVKVFRAQADKGFLPQRVQERCCNFKLLEEKCVEYTKKLGDK